MKDKGINLIEVVLKEEMNFPLTEIEKKIINSLDSDIKEAVLELIQNKEYKEDVILFINNFIEILSRTNQIDNKDVLEKCENKLKELTQYKVIMK